MKDNPLVINGRSPERTAKVVAILEAAAAGIVEALIAEQRAAEVQLASLKAEMSRVRAEIDRL